MKRYDAIVLGGGPAGSATALGLARRGWSVLVAEKKTFPRRKVCGEYLSATNMPLFEELGIAELFHQSAGPLVRRVALFAGDTIVRAPLPALGGSEWGRALSREHLDAFLLDQARQAGAEIRQPATAKQVRQTSDGYECWIEEPGQEAEPITARVVVAAHGSWEKGPLPTQAQESQLRGSDLLGFKAHFQSSSLDADLMPLLVFPGGYGGMVACEDDKVSLSCCVRRDRLTELRHDDGEAGEVVLAHIQNHCRGVREALAGARRVGGWLGAGPIRPGIRLRRTDNVFRVGNAAGEAHPVVAEGISMALQGGWLLSRVLVESTDLAEAKRRYQRLWREAFASRITASRVVAHWAMRPLAVNLIKPILWCFPSMLSWGAKLSGKTHRTLQPSTF